MELTPDDVKHWLSKHNHSREWLAHKCGVVPKTLNNWIGSGRGFPSKAVVIIGNLMKEDAAQEAAKPPHNLVIEFNDEEYQPIERAALRSGQSIREWAKDALNDIAGADVTSIYQRIKDQESQRLAVAEDPAQYDQTKD